MFVCLCDNDLSNMRFLKLSSRLSNSRETGLDNFSKLDDVVKKMYILISVGSV